MWLQPRHVIALAAIAASAIVLQPVTAQAVGSLVTLVGGSGDNHAYVSPSGALSVESVSADLVHQVSDVIVPVGISHHVYTSVCRVTQIYAYSVLSGTLPAQANNLAISVALPAHSGVPAKFLRIATWDSGTPTNTGPVHALTRTALAPGLQFAVGKGSYSWYVNVYCVR
jgi:hypothetical protein